MILVDSNVIVGLFHPKDQHRVAARRDIAKFERQRLVILPAVLAEAVFFLPEPHLRLGLRRWMREKDVTVEPSIETGGHIDTVLDWLEDYAEHSPDWADACLVVASGLMPKAKVWTYDSEFSTIWRRLDGSRVPLAVKA